MNIVVPQPCMEDLAWEGDFGSHSCLVLNEDILLCADQDLSEYKKKNIVSSDIIYRDYKLVAARYSSLHYSSNLCRASMHLSDLKFSYLQGRRR